MRGFATGLLIAAVAAAIALAFAHAQRAVPPRILLLAGVYAAGSAAIGTGLAFGLWACGRLGRFVYGLAAAAIWAAGAALLDARPGAAAVAACGVPVGVAFVLARLSRPAAALWRSAASSGAGPATIIGRVLLPLAAPGIGAAAALVYAAVLVHTGGAAVLLAGAALAPLALSRRSD